MHLVERIFITKTVAEITTDVAWIAKHTGDLRVKLVEVDTDPAAYDAGHIPNAFLWNAHSGLSDEYSKAVAEEALRRLCANSGITPETTIILYGRDACFGYWLLELAGHKNVKLLVGPREQWAEAGYEWSTELPALVDSNYAPRIVNEVIICNREEAADAIYDPWQIVLDVRSFSEYRSEQLWPSWQDGAMPSAVNLPLEQLYSREGPLKDLEELYQIFDQVGVTPEKTISIYCRTGDCASEAWFILKCLLGYPIVRVYYGSWADWGDAPHESLTAEARG